MIMPDTVPSAQTISNDSTTYSIPRAVDPQPVPPDADLKHPALYFNQELGWIDFNWRVLHLAMDERTPLLERVKFVAITASNLDEFMQKRVGGLRRQEAAEVRDLSPDGRSPSGQLDLVVTAVHQMHQTMTHIWEQTLRPLLSEKLNVTICNYDDLTPLQKNHMQAYFQAKIYPILTPLTVDPGHPFPFISNLSLSLSIILEHPQRNTTHFARLKVPTNIGRFLPVKSETDSDSLLFLPIEQLIAHHVGDLFPGLNVVSAHPFRISRSADVSRDEEVAEDLLSMISAELRERKFASVVRLEVSHDMPESDREMLLRELNLDPVDLYPTNGLIDLTSCFQIAGLDFPEHKDEPWEPIIPRRLKSKIKGKDTRSIFTIIRNDGDLIVHHPYESFTASTQRLIEEAAEDPDVLAIKMTLYRTSDESPIVRALIHAAENGKQVAVLVEVKARFDEANNIEWAQMLEKEGVHVAYGLVGLKTHTKAMLIVRKEGTALQTYCHIGTGNYHPKTAKLYTDFGLLTCSPELGQDMINLFHYLTGYAPEQTYQKVLIAPTNMRQVFYELIDQEMINQAEFGNGRIIAKMNGLDDLGIIRKLYEASQAGVQIDLIIRGHSRLRPRLPGYSDNIRIVSILGRFLEHDRIFHFHNNGRSQTYMGSADWRLRNLKSRVELITPIEDPAQQAWLVSILEAALNDNRLAWELDADGNYTLRHPAKGEKSLNFHRYLMKQTKKRNKKKKK